MTDRTQSVMIHNTTPKPRLLSYGVPQGSILGPLQFALYSAPIASIGRRHGLIAHFYADDTQLCIVFDQDAAADHRADRSLRYGDKGMDGNELTKIE